MIAHEILDDPADQRQRPVCFFYREDPIHESYSRRFGGMGQVLNGKPN